MSDPTSDNGAPHGYRGYIGARPYAGQRAPQHVQNIIVRDYAQGRGKHYLLSCVEYAMPGCYMMLEQVMRELDSVEGIIAYSLFMLPERVERRHEIYRRVLDQGKSLHFAVEQLSLTSEADIGRLEDIRQVHELLPRCRTALG